MKMNAKKCLVIIYNHIAHIFFKLGVEHANEEITKIIIRCLSIFKMRKQSKASEYELYTETNSKFLKNNK